MRHRVMRPEAHRFELGRGARFVFGADIFGGFLAPTGVKRQQGSIAALVLGPERQRPRRSVPNAMKASEKAIDQHRTLMRHQIKRVTHQVAVEYGDSGGSGT